MKNQLKYWLLVLMFLPALSLPLACGNSSPTSSSNSGSSAPTNTPTPSGPTNTPTLTGTFTNTQTITDTFTPTNTATKTVTNTATNTMTNTITNTPTNTPTKTWTPCTTAIVMGDANTFTSTTASPSGSGYGYFSNFTTTTSGTLRDIRVYMNGNDYMEVGIFTNMSTSPNLIVASSSINVNTGGGYQWEYFYFPTGTTLSTSTTYSICVLMTGGSSAPTIAEDGGTDFYFLQASDLSSTVSPLNTAYSGKLEIVADLCN